MVVKALVEAEWTGQLETRSARVPAVAETWRNPLMRIGWFWGGLPTQAVGIARFAQFAPGRVPINDGQVRDEAAMSASERFHGIR